jgi:hypothetical protein
VTDGHDTCQARERKGLILVPLTPSSSCSAGTVSPCFRLYVSSGRLTVRTHSLLSHCRPRHHARHLAHAPRQGGRVGQEHARVCGRGDHAGLCVGPDGASMMPGMEGTGREGRRERAMLLRVEHQSRGEAMSGTAGFRQTRRSMAQWGGWLRAGAWSRGPVISA